jgi:hypothetical protein
MAVITTKHCMGASDTERRRNVWIGNNAQADQVAHSAPVSAAAPPPIPKPPRQRKIDGLDFYEYVELIRYERACSATLLWTIHAASLS